MYLKLRNLGITAVLVVLVASCGKSEQQQQSGGPMPFAVQKTQYTTTTTYQSFATTIEGQQNVEIRPKVNGFIEKIFVDEGQQVKKGQLLFKLETQTLSQDAAAAKARVKAAQVEVDRLRPLVERSIISEVQLETAKANLMQLQSAYNSILATINYATITSPVDGVVGSIPYKEGSLVSATNPEPLTTVADVKNVRAYFSMNEKQLLDFSRTSENLSMEAKIKALPQVQLLLADKTLYEEKGTIETLNGLINQRTGTIQLRASFSNPKGILRSGSSGVVQLPVVHERVILIPQIAVFEMQGKQLVYVVGKDNVVQTKVIQTQGTTDLDFIVSSGLMEGELVVVEGVSKLKEGMAIQPSPVKE